MAVIEEAEDLTPEVVVIAQCTELPVLNVVRTVKFLSVPLEISLFIVAHVLAKEVGTRIEDLMIEMIVRLREPDRITQDNLMISA